MKKHLNPTIRDVARSAGVSIGTVSLVLNDRPGLSLATRAHVKEVAHGLAYVPSPIGKALNSKQTGMIGAVMPVASPPLFPEVVEGMNLAAQARGLSLLINFSQDSAAVEARSLRIMNHIRVDGFVLASVPGAGNKSLFKHLISSGAPLVQVERYQPGLPADYVGSNNFRVARDYTARLLREGHDRVGCVLHAAAYTTNQERYRGYAAALKQAGKKVVAGSVLQLSGADPRTAANAIRQYLRQRQGPRGILWAISWVDLLAQQMAELKLENGRNIEIITFDANPFANPQGQKFINLVQDGSRMGSRAFELLVERLHEQVAKVPRAPRQSIRLPYLETVLTGIQTRRAD